MRKFLFSLLLVILPSAASAAVQLPSGKWFEEKITYHRTLTGVLVAVSEWREVFAGGVIKKADASEDTLEETIQNYIIAMSSFAGVDPVFMVRLARCESNLNPEAVGDKGKAYGLYQWWQKSWIYYNKIYKTNLDRESWIDQVKLSTWVIRDYGTDDWINCSKFIKTGSWDFLKKK